MVIQVLFILYVWLVVPETKNRTIEEVTAQFRKWSLRPCTTTPATRKSVEFWNSAPCLFIKWDLVMKLSPTSPHLPQNESIFWNLALRPAYWYCTSTRYVYRFETQPYFPFFAICICLISAHFETQNPLTQLFFILQSYEMHIYSVPTHPTSQLFFFSWYQVWRIF